MEVFVKLVLFVCFNNFVSGSVSPFVNKLETVNVLVPQNDRNLRDSVKQLKFVGEDEDLTENDIIDISEILPDLNLHKTIKKLNLYENNKVNDKQNKNENENKIDEEIRSLMDFTGLSMPNIEGSTNQYKRTIDLATVSTVQHSSFSPTTNSSQAYTEDFTETVTVGYNTTANITQAQSTTSLTEDIPSHYSTPNVKSSEIPETSKFASTDITINTSGAEYSTTNVTMSQTVHEGSTESLTSTTTNPNNSDNIDHTYTLIEYNECVLGTADLYLMWVFANGALNLTWTAIFKKDEVRDYSSKYDEDILFLEYTESLNNTSSSYYENKLQELQNVTVLSLANNRIKIISELFLNIISQSVEYLSLMNNPLNTDRVSFDKLTALKELDLRKCTLKYIKKEHFKNLTNLEKLFLSENYLSTIEANAFSSLGNLLHLDLSHNHIYSTDNEKSSATSLQNIDRGLNINITFSSLVKLKHLDLSFTKIETPSFSAFKYLTEKLEALSLCSTNMPLFIPEMFVNASGLKILDLSENNRIGNDDSLLDFGLAKDSLQVLFMQKCYLKSLDFVKKLSKIEVLGLYSNAIKSLDKESVGHLNDLDILDLGNNFISNWYDRIFLNQSLSILNLRNNKISNLTNDMQSDLKHVNIVGLGENEFDCMCNSKTYDTFDTFDTFGFFEHTLNLPDSFVDTGTASRILTKVMDLVSKSRENLSKKNGRTLRNKSFSSSNKKTMLFDYDEQTYKCIDDNKKIDIYLLRCPMSVNNYDITLIINICVMSAVVVFILCILIYWKWWYIKYSLILLRNSTILSFLNDEDDPLTGKKDCSESDFSYDVFLSYCDENRTWVLDEMLPNIEKREEINICLHERDFQVGYSILENIISCMDRSRVLLLVVSDKFLQSHWCQFEMHLAQHRLLETRRDKLILVLLEDIPSRKQTRTLKYLMKTKTYIKWPVDPSEIEQRKLFWKRLKRAIISTNWENDSYGSIC